MFQASDLVAFLIASVVVTVVPGADMALVTRQVLVGGFGLAQRTILGNLTGLLIHGLALAAGLSALLVASATAYTAVKLAGACYLIYLGVQSLRSAWPSLRREKAPQTQIENRSPTVPSARAAYGQGLISTVLNPKPALFFLTFLPQFIDPERSPLTQALALSAFHIFVGFVWLSAFAATLHRTRQVLTRPAVTRWLEGITGLVLVALGVRVAALRG